MRFKMFPYKCMKESRKNQVNHSIISLLNDYKGAKWWSVSLVYTFSRVFCDFWCFTVWKWVANKCEFFLSCLQTILSRRMECWFQKNFNMKQLRVSNNTDINPVLNWTQSQLKFSSKNNSIKCNISNEEKEVRMPKITLDQRIKWQSNTK